MVFRRGDTQDILNAKRAEYGEEIVATVPRQLSAEFGGGFAEKNLRRMVQLAGTFPDRQILSTLSQELGWSHFVELLPMKKHLQRFTDPSLAHSKCRNTT